MTSLTGVERTFGQDEILVSKTDLKGHITYANDVFLRLAGYPEKQTIGAPHCLIRHPQMPHGVFRLLWSRLGEGKEIFAYIVNRSANGDHYWVLAHVTPTYDAAGKVCGYHSSRRSVAGSSLESTILPIYAAMRDEESRHDNPREKAAAGMALLQKLMHEKATTYEQFIFSLCQ